MPLDDGFTWLVLIIAFFGLGLILIILGHRLQAKIRKMDGAYLDRKIETEQAYADSLFAHAKAIETLAGAIKAHGGPGRE